MMRPGDQLVKAGRHVGRLGANHVLYHKGNAGDGAAFTQVTEFVVLAEDTSEVALTEEDGSRAVRADERRFLPEMRSK